MIVGRNGERREEIERISQRKFNIAFDTLPTIRYEADSWQFIITQTSTEKRDIKE